MTIIAYRDGVMVSDGRVLSDWTIMSDRQVKIRRLHTPPRLIGLSGDPAHFDPYMEWLVTGAKDLRPSLIYDDKNGWASSLLEVHEDGTIIMHEKVGSFKLYGAEFIAIGSGRDAAMAVMRHGASAREAVQFAITANAGCGGEIQEFSFVS